MCCVHCPAPSGDRIECLSFVTARFATRWGQAQEEIAVTQQRAAGPMSPPQALELHRRKRTGLLLSQVARGPIQIPTAESTDLHNNLSGRPVRTVATSSHKATMNAIQWIWHFPAVVLLKMEKMLGYVNLN